MIYNLSSDDRRGFRKYKYIRLLTSPLFHDLQHEIINMIYLFIFIYTIIYCHKLIYILLYYT